MFFVVITSELESKVKLNDISDFAQRIQNLRECLCSLPSLTRTFVLDFKKVAIRLWNVAVEVTHRKLDIGDLNPRRILFHYSNFQPLLSTFVCAHIFFSKLLFCL